MATIQINSFTSWELTKEELLSGTILTVLQKQVLQNRLNEAAETKLNLVYDTLDPIKFAQNEAYLKGKIEFIRYLLDASEAAEEEAAGTHTIY